MSARDYTFQTNSRGGGHITATSNMLVYYVALGAAVAIPMLLVAGAMYLPFPMFAMCIAWLTLRKRVGVRRYYLIALIIGVVAQVLISL